MTNEWDELFDHLEQNPVEKEETEDPIEDCDSECFEGTEVATPSPIRPRPRGYRGETIEDYWGERAEQFRREYQNGAAQEDLVCEETIQVRISDLSPVQIGLSPLPSYLSHAEKKELVWALLRIGRGLEQLPDLNG
jgi:hypothetical protein